MGPCEEVRKKSLETEKSGLSDGAGHELSRYAMARCRTNGLEPIMKAVGVPEGSGAAAAGQTKGGGLGRRVGLHYMSRVCP